VLGDAGGIITDPAAGSNPSPSPIINLNNIRIWRGAGMF